MTTEGGAESSSATPETRGRGRGNPPRPSSSRDLPPPGPRGEPIGWRGSPRRAHWPAALRSTRPRWRARSRRAADWPRAARAASSGHGGCGAAGGRSALAAVPRPRRAASRLVLALLPWLRPPGSRRPLPGRSALCARPVARRRRGAQRAPVGSLPGYAETGARWVSPSGTGASGGGCRRAPGRRTDGPSTRAPPPCRPGAALQGKRPCEARRSSEGRAALRKRLQRVVQRASRDAPTPGGGRVGGLFPGSICRSSGFLKPPPEFRAPAVFTRDPPSGRPRLKRPQPLVPLGALS